MLCRGEKPLRTNSGGDYSFNCSVCGDYLITSLAAAKLGDSPQNRSRLSAWTRQEHEETRHARIRLEHVESPPRIFDGLTVASKMQRALQTMARKFPCFGDDIELTSHQDWPLLCDSGEPEAREILVQLHKLGFIGSEPTFYIGGGCAIFAKLTPRAWQEIESAAIKWRQRDLCFVAMKFLIELEPVFQAIRRAAGRAGYACERVDTVPHSEHIDLRLLDMLRRCRFVIADFTDESPNVYFEAGHARGMDKAVIWTRKSGQAVAFDTRQFYFIDWHERDLAPFEDELEATIGSVVGRLKPKVQTI